MPRRHTLLLSIAILALAAGLAVFSLVGWRGERLTGGSGVAQVGGPFELVDQTGKTVTEKDFLGTYMLVFFGYTYCPDVCPTELQVMMAALDALGDTAAEIRPVFISVDPERDTPDAVRAYVENFGPTLVGLTGTADQVASAAKAYRVYYAKTGGTDGTDYLMDHSSIIYLMGRDGRFLKHFTYTTDAAGLAKGIEAAVTAAP